MTRHSTHLRNDPNMKKSKNQKTFDIEIALKDYLTFEDSDDDALRTLKERILSLRPAERRILLTYIDFGTYSETAREFNVSSTCIRKYINDIRLKLI